MKVIQGSLYTHMSLMADVKCVSRDGMSLLLFVTIRVSPREKFLCCYRFTRTFESPCISSVCLSSNVAVNTHALCFDVPGWNLALKTGNTDIFV
jgi:hypothetical protein